MIAHPIPPASADDLAAGFDPAGFAGEVAVDGQRVRVAALATDAEGRLAFLSLVGYETSVSAALARLMKGEQLGFLPAARVHWDGPSSLQALRTSYWLWRAEIRGTREKQGVAFPRIASIDHGLRTPPLLPTPKPVADDADQPVPDPKADTRAALATLPADSAASSLPARIVLGPAQAAEPAPAAFFGHLKGLRVITLPSLIWVQYLWFAGLHYGLITPLTALGISAWRLNGDPRHWNTLISAGVQDGTLSEHHA
jgi:hypothetical protein